MIDIKTQEELRVRYNPEGSTLRLVQLRLLDMLIYIDEISKKIGAEYQLSSGNVLGAIRHGGFIPWDDDIDIIMKRKDYNILCDYLIRNPHPQYKLQSHKTDQHYYRFWNTLRDTKSEYLNDNKIDKEFKYHGLVIDIFPYETGRILFLKRIATKLATINMRYFIGEHNTIANLVYQCQDKIINPLFNILSFIFGNKKLYDHAYGVGFIERVESGCLFPSKQILFEGKVFDGPANPQEYCESVYGNYKELPPEENRTIHKCDYRIW